MFASLPVVPSCVLQPSCLQGMNGGTHGGSLVFVPDKPVALQLPVRMTLEPGVE